MFVCVYVCRVRVIKLFTFENEKMIYDGQMERKWSAQVSEVSVVE